MSNYAVELLISINREWTDIWTGIGTKILYDRFTKTSLTFIRSHNDITFPLEMYG